MATTINYSYDYYLRNIYSSNRAARKSGDRATMNNSTLVQADSDAMKKITEKLRDMEYSSDNATDIVNNVKLFVETYNNLLESTDGTSSEQVSTLQTKFKKLTKENKDELEELGITVSASGKMTFDKSTFGECSTSKIENFFGSDSEYMTSLRSIASQCKRAARRETVASEDTTSKSKTIHAADTINGTDDSTDTSATASDTVADAVAEANALLAQALLENPENGSTFNAQA